MKIYQAKQIYSHDDNPEIQLYYKYELEELAQRLGKDFIIEKDGLYYVFDGKTTYFWRDE